MELEPVRTELTVPEDAPDNIVYAAYMKALDPTNGTRRTMAGHLKNLAAMLPGGDGVPARVVPWERLRYEHALYLRDQVAGRDWSPSYKNGHLSALRGVLRQAWKLGLIDTDTYERARAIENVEGKRLPVGRSIAPAEVASLLDACEAPEVLSGVRDAAIVAVWHSTGARRAELAAARREDYDPGDRRLRVIGKGNKQRDVYLHEDAARVLGAWLLESEHIKGPLFCPIDKWGHMTDRHLSPRSMSLILDRRRRGASLPHMTPHDWRRTFIGDLLDDGADLVTVQELAGHASPTTTSKYDRRPAQRRKAAVDRRSLPRRGKDTKR